MSGIIHVPKGSKVAIFIRKIEEWKSDAALYKVQPPVVQTSWDEDEEDIVTNYVIVSAVTVFGMPETYIFPADEDGNSLNMLELSGSFKGALDHKKALNNAGFDIIIEEK